MKIKQTDVVNFALICCSEEQKNMKIAMTKSKNFQK